MNQWPPDGVHPDRKDYAARSDRIRYPGNQSLKCLLMLSKTILQEAIRTCGNPRGRPSSLQASQRNYTRRLTILSWCVLACSLDHTNSDACKHLSISRCTVRLTFGICILLDKRDTLSSAILSGQHISARHLGVPANYILIRTKSSC